LNLAGIPGIVDAMPGPAETVRKTPPMPRARGIQPGAAGSAPAPNPLRPFLIEVRRRTDLPAVPLR